MSRAIAILKIDSGPWEAWKHQLLLLPEEDWPSHTVLGILTSIRTTNPRWSVDLVYTEEDPRSANTNFPMIRHGLCPEIWNKMPGYERNRVIFQDQVRWTETIAKMSLR